MTLTAVKGVTAALIIINASTSKSKKVKFKVKVTSPAAIKSGNNLARSDKSHVNLNNLLSNWFFVVNDRAVAVIGTREALETPGPLKPRPV